MNSISKIIINWNIIKKKILDLNRINNIYIKMSLQLISIFGCDNKSSKISGLPLSAAEIKGEVLNDWIQFQKWI